MTTTKEATKNLPPAVAKLKPALRDSCRVDMSGFVIERRAGPIRPHEGESVWLVPYVDPATELEFGRAYKALGEDPDDSAAFNMLMDITARIVLGHDLTDPYGEPLPQFTDGEAVAEGLSSNGVLYILGQFGLANSGETEGEGRAVSDSTANGSSETAPPPTKPA